MKICFYTFFLIISIHHFWKMRTAEKKWPFWNVGSNIRDAIWVIAKWYNPRFGKTPTRSRSPPHMDNYVIMFLSSSKRLQWNQGKYNNLFSHTLLFIFLIIAFEFDDGVLNLFNKLISWILQNANLLSGLSGWIYFSWYLSEKNILETLVYYTHIITW